MNNYIKKYTVIIGLCIVTRIGAERTITLTLESYPITQKNISDMLTQVEKPGRMPKKEMEALLTAAPIDGIFLSYSGFIEASDKNGMVSFNRKHASPHIALVITRDVKPIYTFSNTVHHWELKNNNAALFMVKKEFDALKKYSYWNVTKENLPKNNIIPLEAVILFAQPEHIFVPVGITPIKEKGENLFIPPIYIKKELANNDNVIEALTITHLLRPEKKEIKKQGVTIQHQINE